MEGVAADNGDEKTLAAKEAGMYGSDSDSDSDSDSEPDDEKTTSSKKVDFFQGSTYVLSECCAAAMEMWCGGWGRRSGRGSDDPIVVSELLNMARG